MALPQFIRRRYLTIGGVIAVFVAAGILQLANANPAQSQNAVLTAYAASADPGLDPSASEWKDAVHVQLPLNAQLGAYAAGGGSIPVVTARALHFNNTLYVRLEWEDSTKDDTTVKVENFSDAAAVEFPAKSAATVPSVCMGQAGSGVNIWQWRADSEAGVVDPTQYYTGALVDQFVSDYPLFYTARSAGNPYANPEQGSAQTLMAQAFGTLTPAATQDVRGKGVYEDGRWSVVFARQFGGADADQASFGAGTRTDMAVAVWNGSEGDRNGQKSVSTFVTLAISGANVPTSAGTSWALVFTAIGVLVVAAGLGLALATYGYREGRAS
jgi:complex iron-sulfur molybdoenzyme family reductase subunit gamma